MNAVTYPGVGNPVSDPSTGGRLVTTDGRVLPFRGAALDVDARGGLARVVVQQRFVNDGAEPMQVIDQLALPARAAVGGYAFTIGDRRIVGEVDRREAARERFEEAVIEGRSAAILEQDRADVFQQEIGNIPPGAEVVAEIRLDQPLDWLESGAWEWRFPTVIAPRYMGGEGRVDDRDRVTVDVAEHGIASSVTMSLAIRDELSDGRPSSPSHGIHAANRDGATVVELSGEDGAKPDRDIVVQWPVARVEPRLVLDVARPPKGHAHGSSAFALLTLTPPRSVAPETGVARDLILLLDTSGSMSGQPLDAAREVVLRVIDGLTGKDRLEMIEFSDRPHRWKQAPVLATGRHKRAASKWVRGLQAGGATEMHEGILAALEPLRDDAQRQVVLVTDGLVGFEEEIIGAVRSGLPCGCRVHTVGVGSAPNRSLTTMLARAGRGCEVTIGLDDDPDAAARRLAAKVSAPLVTDIELEGDALLECAGLPDDLAAKSPSLVPIRVRPEGGAVVARGSTAEGPWSMHVTVPACAPGDGSDAIARLFGRAAVADLELAGAVGESVDPRIEELGLSYRIATRRTSWVAVSEEQDVDLRKPVRRVRVPQALPYGMSAEGLGLRAPSRPAHGWIGASSSYECVMHEIAPALTRRRRAEEADASFFMGAEADMPEVGAPATRFLDGRVVQLKDGRLVIEIDLPCDIDWQPTEAVLLPLKEELTDVRICREQTTEAGHWEQGVRIRLVLLGVHVPKSRARQVRVVSGDEVLMILLK